MNVIKKCTIFSILISAMFLIAPSNAHAYLDPGTGSYMLQILLAVFLTSLFALKRFYRKFVGLLGKIIFNKKKDDLDE